MSCEQVPGESIDTAVVIDLSGSGALVAGRIIATVAGLTVGEWEICIAVGFYNVTAGTGGDGQPFVAQLDGKEKINVMAWGQPSCMRVMRVATVASLTIAPTINMSNAGAGSQLRVEMVARRIG